MHVSTNFQVTLAPAHEAVVVTRLYEQAHEYANLANRAGPIPTDLALACQDNGLATTDLRRIALGKSRRRRHGMCSDASLPAYGSHIVTAPLPQPTQTTLIPAETRHPTPDLLPAEETHAALTIPLTIRSLPQPLPALPPKHTYTRTPVRATSWFHSVLADFFEID